MNTRIWELAEQAWHFARDNNASLVDEDGSINWDFLRGYEQKFAELIVLECAELAACNGHVSGFALADLIRQHWGIKP